MSVFLQEPLFTHGLCRNGINEGQLMKRTPIYSIDRAAAVFNLRPPPDALLVDLEGTITPFSPTAESVIEATLRFDQAATQCGTDISKINYVTNAELSSAVSECPRLAGRLHTRAHKPFCTLPSGCPASNNYCVVLGDQYLTDGLMAWHYDLPFCLVRCSEYRPTCWPRFQFILGRAIAPIFFK